MLFIQVLRLKVGDPADLVKAVRDQLAHANPYVTARDNKLSANVCDAAHPATLNRCAEFVHDARPHRGVAGFRRRVPVFHS